jgi:two-component system, cell cycle sensor histidine kinase and response regulator CckA
MVVAKRSIQRRAEEGSLFGATPEQLLGALPLALQVLLLENSAADADLILHELREGGYEPVARRVASREEMLEALSEGSWQIVFLDYSLGGGALEALASLAELEIDLPAILISGVIGEGEAADALRAGARDFVSKGNLTRLVPAVVRELGQVEARRRQREGEEALRESEQRLRLALDAGGMGWCENNPISGRLHWSDKLQLMFGLEPGAFGGTRAEFIGLVHPDDRGLVEASIEQALRHDASAVVYRALWPDGTVRWHERKSQRVPDADGLVYGVTFDVTEREEATQALRESEERFRLIAEHAQDLIALLDSEGRFSYLSPSWESALGYPAGALLGTVALELIHPDDWPEGAKLGEGKLRELRHRKADGSWLWVEGLSYSVAGRLTASHFAVIARDISERRRAEDRLHDLFENANDLISTCDLDGRLTSANGAFARLSGHARPELIGMKFDQLYTADSVSRAKEMRRRKLEGEMRATTYEMEMVAKDGGSVPIEVSTRLIVEGGKPVGTQSIGRDLSERKLLEEELRQAQKMEAVGQFAGGIAHDFNNLLSVISGYTEILLRRLGREGEESKEIVEINKAAERAARLTRQLLAYSRKQLLEPRVLDLNDLVSEAQTMLERVIGENIEFSTTLADDLGCISADQGQIEQIIMNLVVNARDAMPQGGTLLLETCNVTRADLPTSTRSDTTAGDYVLLAVTDTGHGMDAATAARIFEPFYTTKARDVGTGLGLSTVYGIVKQSGGHIEVESEPGMGTSFRLYFPQVAEKAEAFSPKPPDERSLIGSETVLLVEDEAALRAVGKEMLEMYGYTVLLAGDGAAGLELAQNHPDPIQLLMTDILMPKMGGTELAARLSTLRPELKVLYTSGYNDSGNSPQSVAGARYLQKPYAMEDLARTLRELLDPAHPAVTGPPAGTREGMP